MTIRQRDMDQLANLVVDTAAGEVDYSVSEERKHPTKKRGQIAGMKGGPIRAAKLTPTQRKGMAVRATKARWGKPKKNTNALD